MFLHNGQMSANSSGLIISYSFLPVNVNRGKKSAYWKGLYLLKTHDFYYDLPEELIAQTPLERRDASRLMTLDRKTGEVTHRHFYDLLELLQPGDCLVMNNSRVLPARLLGHRVPSGGAVEVLLLKDQGNGIWECLTKPGRKTHTGTELSFGDGDLTATVVGERDDGNKLVQFHYEGIFLEVLERDRKSVGRDRV